MVNGRISVNSAFSVASMGGLVLAFAVSTVAGADVSWSGGDGAQNWHDAGNWNPAEVPGEGNNNTAILGDATSDRTISGNPSGGKLDWDQTTSGVTQTIVMDRFWNPPWGLAADSSVAGGSGLIIDLNGNRLKLNMTAVNTINGMKGVRFVDTDGSGWLESDNIGLNAASSVGPGVEMRSGRGESRSFGSWDPTAILTGTQTRFDINQIDGPTGLGHVIMGVDNQNNYLMENDTEGRIQGDWSITGQGAKIQFAGAGRKLIVNGNFTDVNNDGLDYSGAGSTLVFAGNPVSPRTVDIGRSLLLDMAVGLSGESGDIVLGQSLTTSGTFDILSGSKVNVGLNTLTTGDLNLLAGSELEIGFGSAGQVVANGAVALDGNLTLDLSSLTALVTEITLIDNDGTDPLVGTFANAPSGTTYNSPVGTYSLAYNFNGNDLALTFVPEPASVVLVSLGGLMLARRRRHFD